MRTLSFAIFSACLAAQGQTPPATFEVASIKPATPLGPLGRMSKRTGGPGTTDPGLYRCQNCPLSWIVSEAYGVRPFEFSPPEWVETVRFDFEARIPPGTSKQAFQEMLQNLLAERFKLAVHREKKDMQVYELGVGRNGPKFKESVPKDASGDDAASPGKVEKDSDGFPVLTPGMTMAMIPGHARLRSDNQSIAWLIGMLAGQLSGPVTDATNLKGKYDFVLSWAWEEKGSAAAAGTAMPLASDPASGLVEAVQSQLGLTLRQKRGQAEMLVIDHMERSPTAN